MEHYPNPCHLSNGDEIQRQLDEAGLVKWMSAECGATYRLTKAGLRHVQTLLDHELPDPPPPESSQPASASASYRVWCVAEAGHDPRWVVAARTGAEACGLVHSVEEQAFDPRSLHADQVEGVCSTREGVLLKENPVRVKFPEGVKGVFR